MRMREKREIKWKNFEKENMVEWDRERGNKMRESKKK